AGEAWREHLEREAFADRRVLRQEHGPHAARAEHLEQAIAARDDVARVQGGILERRRGGGGRGGFVLGLRLVARRGCGGGWCVARGRRNRVVFGRRGGVGIGRLGKRGRCWGSRGGGFRCRRRVPYGC